MPSIVREATATVTQFVALLDNGGLLDLQSHLRKQRATPRFDTFLWPSLPLAYAHFAPEKSTEDARSAATRQRRPSVESWIGVPADFRDADLTQVSEELLTRTPVIEPSHRSSARGAVARWGLNGFLVTFRHRPRAWSIVILLQAAAPLSLSERRRAVEETFHRFRFWESNRLPQDPALRHLGVGRGPPPGTRPNASSIPFHAIWTAVGDQKMEDHELAVALGLLMSADRVLKKAEGKRIWDAVRQLVNTTASAMEAESLTRSGMPFDLGEVVTRVVERATTKSLATFDAAQPKSLRKYIRVALRHEGWREIEKRRLAETNLTNVSDLTVEEDEDPGLET